MKLLFLFSLYTFIFMPFAHAGEVVYYKDGDLTLEGYLAKPDPSAFSGKRPVVLVIHQWKGLGDYEKKRAEMLAEQGYVAFALDMYGQGVRPKEMADSAAESSKYKNNPELARSRSKAALDYIKTIPDVDGEKIAAIGYCFGGTMALEMARAGFDLAGVVSFHGGLSTQAPAQENAILGAVQVHHGADDPLVSQDEVLAFQEEMRESKADWHFISYANAVHAFTEKEAGSDPSNGVAYNEKADIRSWAYTLKFLEETL